MNVYQVTVNVFVTAPTDEEAVAKVEDAMKQFRSSMPLIDGFSVEAEAFLVKKGTQQ